MMHLMTKLVLVFCLVVATGNTVEANSDTAVNDCNDKRAKKGISVLGVEEAGVFNFQEHGVSLISGIRVGYYLTSNFRANLTLGLNLNFSDSLPLITFSTDPGLQYFFASFFYGKLAANILLNPQYFNIGPELGTGMALNFNWLALFIEVNVRYLVNDSIIGVGCKSGIEFYF
jgi:hypothetical protein